MIGTFGIGIGAGLVSALLFAVVITGSPLAVLLSVAAPLPILIAGLGWNHRAGLVGTAAGAVATALGFKLAAGVAFAAGWGLPAWWLAYLALLARPAPDGSPEWYPLGRLLLWVGATAALVTVFGVVAIGSGDFGAYRDHARRVLETFVRVQAGLPREAPLPPAGGFGTGEVIEAVVGALPFFVASSFAIILALNLWIGAKVVQMSQRLPRPWPFVPAAAMPRLAIRALAAGVALAFAPGFVGVAGLALLGGLNVAFALQGLALVHDTTRGRPGRGALLAATYIFALFISQIAWPLLALAGIADVAVGLRRRLTAAPGGPPSNDHPR